MENQNNIPVNDELIARYLSGEANADEAVALHTWLASPANKMHFDELSASWHSALPSRRPRQIKVDAAWSAVQRQLVKEPSPRKTTGRYLAMAASLTLFIAAGLGYYYHRATASTDPVVLSTADTPQHIRLSDHSVVILNRHSTFSYPESFADGRREVDLLKGEGFFDITPDRDRPFVIHTATGSIQVIGTVFNVIVDESYLQVGVKEGKVMVFTGQDSVLVIPGTEARITPGRTAIEIDTDADINDWGYATGLFVFKDTPLSQVISKIEKSHPFQIRISNQNINNCRLTATFENVSAENMLSLIAETLNLSVTRNGKIFTITGEGCR